MSGTVRDYIPFEIKNDCISHEPRNVGTMITIAERDPMHKMPVPDEVPPNYPLNQDIRIVPDAVKLTSIIVGYRFQTNRQRLCKTIEMEIETKQCMASKLKFATCWILE